MEDEQCYSATVDQIIDMFWSISDSGWTPSAKHREAARNWLELDASENDRGYIVVRRNTVKIGSKWYGRLTADKVISYIREAFDVYEDDGIVLK